jgi:ubiquinone/menaquinone biosynthesis C-methylase UbiE
MDTRGPPATLFDRWAVTYDLPGLQAVVYRPVHDAILALLTDARPSTVIDLGCGTGQLTARLLERFPEATVIAVDLSAGMLFEAAARLGPGSSDRCALVRADAERLPVASSSTDLVVCTESFHWYRHQATALEGLADVLRPGGRLIIASIASVTRLGEDLVRRMTSLSGRPIRAVPPDRLRGMLDRSGFDVVHQRRIPRLGPAVWPVLTAVRRR